MIVWLLGRPGSGKSEIAKLLASKQYRSPYRRALVLDENDLNDKINFDIANDYSPPTIPVRTKRLAEIAKIINKTNTVVIVCSVHASPCSREILGKSLYEIYLDCPIMVAEHHDNSGLYKRARYDQISNFPGINMPFNPPELPVATIKTNEKDIDKCSIDVYNLINKWI